MQFWILGSLKDCISFPFTSHHVPATVSLIQNLNKTMLKLLFATLYNVEVQGLWMFLLGTGSVLFQSTQLCVLLIALSSCFAVSVKSCVDSWKWWKARGRLLSLRLCNWLPPLSVRYPAPWLMHPTSAHPSICLFIHLNLLRLRPPAPPLYKPQLLLYTPH